MKEIWKTIEAFSLFAALGGGVNYTMLSTGIGKFLLNEASTIWALLGIVMTIAVFRVSFKLID